MRRGFLSTVKGCRTRRGRSEKPRAGIRYRRLSGEILEGRRLLSIQSPQIELFNASPALFAENQGQWADPAIRYVFQGDGANVAMTDAGPVFQVFQAPPSTPAAASGLTSPLPLNGRGAGGEGMLPGDEASSSTPVQSEQFSVHFDGANLVAPTGMDQAATVFNYLVGDQSQWHTNVPTYQKVAYNGLYSGIDLVTQGRRDSLKYEFHVAPGADYQQIRIHYDGIEGLSLDARGMLHVQTALGELTDDAPFVYQQIGGQQVAVAGQFKLLDADTYTFTITGAYEGSQELVIDPNLAWSTYLGGSVADYGRGIAVDSAGNALVAGITKSSDFSGANNGFDGGGDDTFVAKITSGGALAWATYLGGSGNDSGNGIAVDSAGNALVTGTTGSTDFSGANNSYHGGAKDTFVAKVTSGGALAWATYLGGSGWDHGNGIAVDSAGSALVAGWSNSTAFSAANNSYHGGQSWGDTFVAKVTSAGALAWATYLGGSGDDYGVGIAVDRAGSAFVTGAATSTDFSGANNSYRGGYRDAFVAKVTGAGTLAWATYLGGSGYDGGVGIAVDSAGNALVTGLTGSSDFSGANNSLHGGSGFTDAFVAKVTGAGALAWATYLGGSQTDLGDSIAVDGAGSALVTGYTNSTDFSGANNGYGAGGDIFVAKVTGAGIPAWATYMSGVGYVRGDPPYPSYGIAVDNAGSAVVTGYTNSTDFSGANNSYHGGSDAFVAKLTGAGTPFDVGDTASMAQDLGILVIGTPVARSEEVGNGAYGVKDVDLYKFTVGQAGTVTLDVAAQSNGSSLDAYLRLFDDVGRQIAYNDDHDGSDPYLSISLPPGTYFAGVSGYANRYYDPGRGGSGVAGRAGPYMLNLSLSGSGGGAWNPTITASATYDGNPDPAVFGRYLTGPVAPELWNTFSAYVSVPSGFTTTAITFDANFNGARDAGDYTDTSSGDGWTWARNVSRLDANKTLSIWAEESGGTWSSAATFTIQTLTAPAWLDPDLTTIIFSASSGTYQIDSLIGKRFGVETPESFPDFLEYRNGRRTFNGVYTGISVQADMSLSGQVVASSVAPVVGYSFLGFEQSYRIGNRGSSFSIEIDLFRFIDLYKDPVGYFKSNLDDRVSGFYDERQVAPTVTLSYESDISLNNSLQFTHFSTTYEMSVSATGSLFEMDLPKAVFPIPALPIVSLELTPHIGWSPSFAVSYQMGLGPLGPQFQSASINVGAEGGVGVTGEVAVLGGAASGGVDITGALGLSFDATYNGSWTYSIPLTLGMDIDFVGSLLWGVLSGRVNVYEWEWTGNLWSSGGGASIMVMAPPRMALNSSSTDLTLVDAAIARSADGQIGYAWTVPSQDGTASTLRFQQMVDSVWQAPEVLVDTDYHRGNPALVSLGPDQWMVMWSQSNLPTGILGSLTAETVVSEQEIWYARNDGSGWGSPVRLTTNSTCDDSPELVARPNGTVVAVWRQMSGVDLGEIGGSNLVYTVWDGATWTAPATLADTPEQLSQSALAVLSDGSVLAVWMSDASDSGSQVTILSSSFNGVSWTTPLLISDAAPASRNWPLVAALPDGTAVALWSEQKDQGHILISTRRNASGEWSITEAVTPYQALTAKPAMVAAGSLVQVVYHGYTQRNEVLATSRDFADPNSLWSELELLSPEDGDAWWAFAEVDQQNQLQIRYVLNNDLQEGAIVALADLEVERGSLALQETPASPGIANEVIVTVSNRGWAASDSTEVALFAGDPNAGGTLLASETLPGLAVGQSTQVFLPWLPDLGDHELWIVADPNGTLTESREDNNVESLSVTVLDAPTVELDPVSDTGTPGDNWTTNSAPTVIGTTPTTTSVAIYVDSQVSRFAQATVSGTSFTVTVPALTFGPHTIWAQAFDTSGNSSPFSAPLNVYIDTVPVIQSPVLDPTSDSGSVGDGITNVRRPKIIGTAKPSASMQIFDAVNLLGEVTASGTGAYEFIPGADLTEGLHDITVRQGDPSGGFSEPSAALTLTLDTTAPTVTIAGPSTPVTARGPIGYTVSFADANFNASTLSAADVTLNRTDTANGTVSVSSGTGLTRTITISNIVGDGTLGIAVAAGTASDTAGNLAPAAGPSATFVVDNTAPTISVGSPSGSITAGGPIAYTVTYADANFNASTLSAGDVTLNRTGTADGVVSVSSGAGLTRTVTISDITGDGALGISLVAGTASDTAGNLAPAAGASGTFVVDNTAPTITVGSPSASITARGPITYTVTYADANFNASMVSVADVTLNRTGTANGAVSVSSGTGLTRTITISNITGDGTLGISVAAGTASDTAGNLAPAAGPSDTFAVDNTAPTITIGSASASTTTEGPITYMVTYADGNFSASTLSVDDVTLNRTGTANGTVSVSSGTGLTRTITISNIVGDGTLGISVATRTASDTAGNLAPAAGPSDTFVVDNTRPPQPSMNAPDVPIGGGTSYFFTVTYTDNDAIKVSTLDNSDIVVTGPKLYRTLATFDHVDINTDGTPRMATYRITPPGGMWDRADNGDYVAWMQSDEVTDTSGNSVLPTLLDSFAVKARPDKIPPKASLTAPNVTTAGDTSYTFTVTYTDNVEVRASTLDSLDVRVTGPHRYSQLATLDHVDVNANGTPRTATYRITPPGGSWSAASNGVYTVRMQPKQVKDTSGNAVIARKLGTFTVDTVAPTASLTARNVTKAGGKSHTFTVTYADNLALSVATLDNSDILVTGPNGFSQAAMFVSVNNRKNGTPRKATYRLIPPGGTWDAVDNGTYTISIQPNQVGDKCGNPVAADPRGTFTVDVPAATVAGAASKSASNMRGPGTSDQAEAMAAAADAAPFPLRSRREVAVLPTVFASIDDWLWDLSMS